MRSFIAAAGILLATTSALAQQPAEGWPWPGHVEHHRNGNGAWRQPEPDHVQHHYRRQHPRVVYVPERPAPRVAGWMREEPRQSREDWMRCRAKMTAVGDQFASEDGAKSEAVKAFSQAARWAYGEKLMNIEHAQGVTYQCNRSSVGSVMGATMHRCEIVARPCEAPVTPGVLPGTEARGR